MTKSPIKSPLKSFPEPSKSFTKKFGATTYIINAYFPDKCNESFDEKLLRIIESDLAKSAAAS